MRTKHFNILLFFCFLSTAIYSQSNRWQQRIDYRMDIDFNTDTHQYQGSQTIQYYNNSPDTLTRIFYHLYFNAFQPGSMMDIRSRTIADPDRRVRDRIQHLSENEMGYIEVKSLKQDGTALEFKTVGTILEVNLSKPLLPGNNTQLKMVWDAQVPVQIRRSGRDNNEGIDYSMAQWYPKLCEYDDQGWHANPYIAREFYGVWGDFDVKISISPEYILGASGLLSNRDKIGYGTNMKKLKNWDKDKEKRTWHFKAENVHDFVWTADPDYVVNKLDGHNGTTLYFLYQPGESTKSWDDLPGIINEALKFMNANYGVYPYPVYSFLQGGDGGMEYPMATLITGERSLPSLVGVSVHEWMHSWYQMVLGTNESLYPWMDEGFTSFASTETMNHLREEKILTDKSHSEKAFKSTFNTYINYMTSDLVEPLSLHSDHHSTNSAYGRNAYTKGSVFLKQLEYIVGKPIFRKALLRYFNTWKFKHPKPNDFMRIFEKTSGLELDWYKEYMLNTTHLIDYSVYAVTQDPGLSMANIVLLREEKMPMPLDLQITYADGSITSYTIPLRIMRGSKTGSTQNDLLTGEDWPWTHPVYVLELETGGKEIIEVVLDPEEGMADINRYNNVWIKDTP